MSFDEACTLPTIWGTVHCAVGGESAAMRRGHRALQQAAAGGGSGVTAAEACRLIQALLAVMALMLAETSHCSHLLSVASTLLRQLHPLKVAAVRTRPARDAVLSPLAFPPSSSVTEVRFFAAAAITIFPTLGLPVKKI